MTKDKLLPKHILEQLPKLLETEKQENPLVIVKFFYPDFSWTWYAIEFDGRDVFYGLVDGFEVEFGTFSLKELMENRGQLGFEIERDFYFKPTPVNELYQKLTEARPTRF